MENQVDRIIIASTSILSLIISQAMILLLWNLVVESCRFHV